MKKSLFCIPLVGVCSFLCLILTGCGGGGNPLPPPAAVTGLGYVRTADAPGTVQLAWNPGSRRATKGYLVGRRLQGESSFVRRTPAPITSPTFRDEMPPGMELVTATYQVVAVDKKNRVGPPAEIQAVVAPPPAPF